MQKLEIRKGGKLIDTRWIYDREAKKGEYIEFDVTDDAIHYLFKICCLEKGLILKDLFLLLNKYLDVFDLIFGNWLKEIVTEGLTKEAKPYGEYHKDNIEYLELYWVIYKDENTFQGYDYPEFNGVGYELREDANIFEKKGTRINWGVSYSPGNNLINIPLKLNNKFIIWDETKFKEITSFDNATFTLANIIYGVIWEMSWNGNPEDREEKHKELHNVIKEIKKDESNITSIK